MGWSPTSGSLLGGEPASPSPLLLPLLVHPIPQALCQTNKIQKKKKGSENIYIQLRGFIYKTMPTERERSSRTSILKNNR